MGFLESGFIPAHFVPDDYFPDGIFPVYATARFDNAKELAIWLWAQTVVGDTYTVIWDKPGEPRPARPYVTLNIRPISNIAPMDITYSVRDTYIYNFKKKARLTVNVYADNEYIKKCNELIDSLDIENYRCILRQGGIAVWNVSEAIDLSELIDTDFEFRASFDAIVSYNVARTVTLTEIEKVTYTGTLGTRTITDTIIKP